MPDLLERLTRRLQRKQAEDPTRASVQAGRADEVERPLSPTTSPVVAPTTQAVRASSALEPRTTGILAAKESVLSDEETLHLMQHDRTGDLKRPAQPHRTLGV